MGWTGEWTYGRLTYAEEKRRIEAMYTWENVEAGIQVRPLKVCQVRPDWYVAVEVIASGPHKPFPFVAETLPDGRCRYVYCEVIMTRSDRKEWCHKEIAESSGPNSAKAPASLIALLSPLEPPSGKEWDSAEWAANWRAKCLSYAAAKSAATTVKPGDVIRLAAPVRFSNGIEADTFRKGHDSDLFYAGDLPVILRKRDLIAREWVKVPA